MNIIILCIASTTTVYTITGDRNLSVLYLQYSWLFFSITNNVCGLLLQLYSWYIIYKYNTENYLPFLRVCNLVIIYYTHENNIIWVYKIGIQMAVYCENEQNNNKKYHAQLKEQSDNVTWTFNNNYLSFVWWDLSLFPWDPDRSLSQPTVCFSRRNTYNLLAIIDYSRITYFISTHTQTLRTA